MATVAGSLLARQGRTEVRDGAQTAGKTRRASGWRCCEPGPAGEAK
jgi:hypothetical protein